MDEFNGCFSGVQWQREGHRFLCSFFTLARTAVVRWLKQENRLFDSLRPERHLWDLSSRLVDHHVTSIYFLHSCALCVSPPLPTTFLVFLESTSLGACFFKGYCCVAISPGLKHSFMEEGLLKTTEVPKVCKSWETQKVTWFTGSYWVNSCWWRGWSCLVMHLGVSSVMLTRARQRSRSYVWFTHTWK